MGINKEYVFVYGTLRMHESNHYLLASAKKVAEQAWTHGRLYDTGNGYPGMLMDKKERVYGEIYQVTEKELEELDELEGYIQGKENNLYDRVRQSVYTDQGKIKANVYIYLDKLEEEKNYIPYGDWKIYRLTNQNSVLYFAYGSCMDDQRFHQAGVEKYFTDVIGCGLLSGYRLRYTRIAKDGGRADIVERNQKNEVQGKVYRLKKEVLPYLYRREGVEASIYRPASIQVEINGKRVQDVLTFIMVRKEKETAPPYGYAEEIIRGGYGTVSDEYLLEHINYLKTKHKLDMNKLKKQLFCRK